MVPEGSPPDNPEWSVTRTDRLLSPSRCLCGSLIFLLAAGCLSVLLVLRLCAPFGLSTYLGKFLLYTQELVLSSLLCLASPHRVWPFSLPEILGSAPHGSSVEAPPIVGGATSKKRRPPLRFFGDGGSYRLHLFHHLFTLFGKLGAKEKWGHLLEITVVSDDW